MPLDAVSHTNLKSLINNCWFPFTVTNPVAKIHYRQKLSVFQKPSLILKEALICQCETVKLFM
jgi:hypothetical protein